MKLPLTALHLDYHIPELSIPAFGRFDMAHYLEQLRRSDAEAVTLFAKDHFGNSFYPTRAGHRHRDLPCDLLGTAAAELRKAGKRVLAYYSLCWEKRAADLHPEWRQLDAENRPFGAEGPWGTVCVNSPYMEELVLPQLREIVGWYPVHGIFIDIAMMNPQGCFCPHCRERFRAETGRELTPGPEQRRFAAESMRRALRKIREAAGSLALCANASWGIGQPVEIADIVDFLVVESQPAHVSSGGYLLQMMQAKYCHADGRPFQIITVRFHGGGWGELSLKSREQLCYEFSLIAAHGGKVCCGDQGDYDGNLDAGTHRTLREAFDFVREREPFLGGRARRHIAVYCGEQGSFPFSVDELPPELPGMAGLLAGLNEQFEFCSSAALLRNLEHYAAVLVPGGTALPEAVRSALDAYVGNGGVLIREPSGVPEGHCYWEDGGETILLRTGYRPLELRDGDRVITGLRPPLVPYAPPGVPWRSSFTPPAPEGVPGAVARPRGAGLLIETAVPFSRNFWRTGDTRLLRAFRRLLEEAGITPAVRISAPGFDVNIVDDGDARERIHFVHYSAERNTMAGYPVIRPHTPFTCRVSLRSRRCPFRATLQPAGRNIPFSREGEELCFELPADTPYVILELEYQPEGEL